MTTRLMHCGRQRSKHGGPPCQKHDTNFPCFSLRGPCLFTTMYPTTFLDRKEVLQPRELAPSPLKPSFHRGVPMHNTTRGTSVMKTTYGSLSAIPLRDLLPLWYEGYKFSPLGCQPSHPLGG